MGYMFIEILMPMLLDCGFAYLAGFLACQLVSLLRVKNKKIAHLLGIVATPLAMSWLPYLILSHMYDRKFLIPMCIPVISTLMLGGWCGAEVAMIRGARRANSKLKSRNATNDADLPPK